MMKGGFDVGILDSLLVVEIFELIVQFGILIVLAVRADRKGK